MSGTDYRRERAGCSPAGLAGRRTGIEKLNMAPVAQLDRASASGAEGQRFESSRARHSFEVAYHQVMRK